MKKQVNRKRYVLFFVFNINFLLKNIIIPLLYSHFQLSLFHTHNPTHPNNPPKSQITPLYFQPKHKSAISYEDNCA